MPTLQPEQKPIHNYPESFSLRIMGENRDNFELLVSTILTRHVKDLEDDNFKQRSSSGGKYLSITVTFTAQSQEQVEALYRELSTHPRVLMIL